jgi:branched-chain amino acid transport system substrate-binding protein
MQVAILKIRPVGVIALTALWLLGCQPNSANRAASSDEVLIGATLPLSGALASFGGFQKWGYEHAVAEYNAAGGIRIDGRPRRVRLIIRDDQSDPNRAAANVDSLVSLDHVDALLGSATPPLVIAASLAAERNAKPIVNGAAPLISFRTAKAWNWSWDVFFDERELAEAAFRTIEDLGVVTNRRVAILRDNGADGAVIGGKLWPEYAAKYGYQLVTDAEFPVDTTDFGASVQRVRAAGADIVLVMCVTSQAVSIRKQMAASGFTPKVLVMEKGAEPVQFAEAVGKLADGVIVGGYWDPSVGYSGARELGEAFARETGHGVSQHIADSYTAARVLLDAIATAQSVDAQKVNAAIAKTDHLYPVGPVKFGENHAARLPLVELQWQGGATQVIWPVERKTARGVFPMPGGND